MYLMVRMGYPLQTMQREDKRRGIAEARDPPKGSPPSRGAAMARNTYCTVMSEEIDVSR